jgi:hypothetical protein
MEFRDPERCWHASLPATWTGSEKDVVTVLVSNGRKAWWSLGSYRPELEAAEAL